MSKVRMYCTDDCPFCRRAEALLEKRGAPPEKIRLVNAEMWEDMERLTGRNTVPQIFIGERHVGGFDDLVELDMEGDLEELLSA